MFLFCLLLPLLGIFLFGSESLFVLILSLTSPSSLSSLAKFLFRRGGSCGGDEGEAAKFRCIEISRLTGSRRPVSTNATDPTDGDFRYVSSLPSMHARFFVRHLIALCFPVSAYQLCRRKLVMPGPTTLRRGIGWLVSSSLHHRTDRICRKFRTADHGRLDHHHHRRHRHSRRSDRVDTRHAGLFP